VWICIEWPRRRSDRRMLAKKISHHLWHVKPFRVSQEMPSSEAGYWRPLIKTASPFWLGGQSSSQMLGLRFLVVFLITFQKRTSWKVSKDQSNRNFLSSPRLRKSMKDQPTGGAILYTSSVTAQPKPRKISLPNRHEQSLRIENDLPKKPCPWALLH